MQPLYRAERPRGRMLPTHRRFSIDLRLDRVNRYQVIQALNANAKFARRALKRDEKNVTVASTTMALKSGMALIKWFFAFLSLGV